MNQSDTRTLDSSDIVIGKPLTWPVYDKYGHLLLRKGYVIASDSQLAWIFTLIIRLRKWRVESYRADE
ncbi:MAG: hypothetical protein GY774_15825 [Planctomycetes bacterium]|nr:hypothetical protein [Planctomycetota bacterium]